MITDDPASCACRRRPWLTIAMLGGIHYVRDDGIRLVRCPDRDHCPHGAPIVHGDLGEHWRNMPALECKWAGIRVRDKYPVPVWWLAMAPAPRPSRRDTTRPLLPRGPLPGDGIRWSLAMRAEEGI